MSDHSSRSPLRWSGCVAIRQNVAAIASSEGSSLSAGFSQPQMAADRVDGDQHDEGQRAERSGARRLSFRS